MVMSDVLLEICSNSLALNLEKLAEHPTIQASQELSSYVKNAQDFHREMGKQIQPLLDNNIRLGKQLYDFIADASEWHVIKKRQDDFVENFAPLLKAGVGPELMYRIAIASGFNAIGSSYILIKLFGLSLRAAVELRAQIEEQDRLNQQHTEQS